MFQNLPRVIATAASVRPFSKTISHISICPNINRILIVEYSVNKYKTSAKNLFRKRRKS
jgi:hypothetical protein